MVLNTWCFQDMDRADENNKNCEEGLNKERSTVQITPLKRLVKKGFRDSEVRNNEEIGFSLSSTASDTVSLRKIGQPLPLLTSH